MDVSAYHRVVLEASPNTLNTCMNLGIIQYKISNDYVHWSETPQVWDHTGEDPQNCAQLRFSLHVRSMEYGVDRGEVS